MKHFELKVGETVAAATRAMAAMQKAGSPFGDFQHVIDAVRAFYETRKPNLPPFNAGEALASISQAQRQLRAIQRSITQPFFYNSNTTNNEQRYSLN